MYIIILRKIEDRKLISLGEKNSTIGPKKDERTDEQRIRRNNELEGVFRETERISFDPE